jgi:hypothetical protein
VILPEAVVGHEGSLADFPQHPVITTTRLFGFSLSV